MFEPLFHSNFRDSVSVCKWRCFMINFPLVVLFLSLSWQTLVSLPSAMCKHLHPLLSRAGEMLMNFLLMLILHCFSISPAISNAHENISIFSDSRDDYRNVFNCFLISASSPCLRFRMIWMHFLRQWWSRMKPDQRSHHANWRNGEQRRHQSSLPVIIKRLFLLTFNWAPQFHCWKCFVVLYLAHSSHHK